MIDVSVVGENSFEPIHGYGVSGYTGVQGVTGYQGATGTVGSGFTGFWGVIGITGVQGTTGFSGFTGFQGYTGFSGVRGYQGVTGFGGNYRENAVPNINVFMTGNRSLPVNHDNEVFSNNVFVSIIGGSEGFNFFSLIPFRHRIDFFWWCSRIKRSWNILWDRIWFA